MEKIIKLLLGGVFFGLFLNFCMADITDIVPSPKELITLSGELNFNPSKTIIIVNSNSDPILKTGSEIIKNKIYELSGKNIEIKTEDTVSKDELENKDLIILGTPDSSRLIKNYLENKKNDFDKIKNSGYMISSETNKSATRIMLTGNDTQGALYSCITFIQILKDFKDNKIYFPNIKIVDWPDNKHRAIQISPNFDLTVEKSFFHIDRCMYYKNSMAFVSLYKISDGSYKIPDDQRIIKWLSDFNRYSSSHGIKTIGSCLFATVGYKPEDKNRPEFKNLMEYGKGYCSWSRDELIKKRAEKAAQFIKGAGFEYFVFHFKDGSPTESWSSRSQECKKRFGDDRASADANYINIMYKEVKKKAPSVRLIFVVEPYYGNLDIPENSEFKKFFEKLTRLIPSDVYLTCTSFEKEAQDSWKKVLRQPIFQWRNMTMDPYHSGCLFTTEPVYGVRSGYYPQSEDISYMNVKGSEVINLLSSECMWNVRTGGDDMIRANLKSKPVRYVENLYNYVLVINEMKLSEWHCTKAALEPEIVTHGLLEKFCRHIYGAEAAPVAAEVFRMGIVKRILLMSGPLYEGKGFYYNYFNNPEVIKDQYQKAGKAVSMLSKLNSKATGAKDVSHFSSINALIEEMKVSYYAGKARYHILLSKQMLKDGKRGDALKEVENVEKILKEAFSNIAKCNIPLFDKIKQENEDLRFKISLFNDKKIDKDTIKVGIYSPETKGGRVYGYQTIYNTLLQSDNFTPELIPDLKNISDYDLIIFPDCKKFGNDDDSSVIVIEKEIHNVESKLREYVMDEGKGVVFYHDSVGFTRFPLGKSIFPELCANTKMVKGQEVKAVSSHYIAEGIDKNKIFRHLYNDHIAMTKGENGTAVLENANGDSVVIAGELGKGRVVMNGCYIPDEDEKGNRLKEVHGIDKDILLNSLMWLAKKNK